MSVSIRWAHAPDGKSFDGGSSTDLAALEEVFGKSPIKIGPEDSLTLRAMAAAGGFGKEFFMEVARTVEDHGAITIWGVW